MGGTDAANVLGRRINVHLRETRRTRHGVERSDACALTHARSTRVARTHARTRTDSRTCATLCPVLPVLPLLPSYPLPPPTRARGRALISRSHPRRLFRAR